MTDQKMTFNDNFGAILMSFWCYNNFLSCLGIFYYKF